MSTYEDTKWGRMSSFLNHSYPWLAEAEEDDEITPHIVGYRYMSRLIHGVCLLKMMCLHYGSEPTEKILNDEAEHEGIDRSDELGFSHMRFPHRLFNHPELDETPCASCGNPLAAEPF